MQQTRRKDPRRRSGQTEFKRAFGTRFDIEELLHQAHNRFVKGTVIFACVNGHHCCLKNHPENADAAEMHSLCQCFANLWFYLCMVSMMS